MLAIGKSAWSAKESKYIGVHCPLAITQGRISESLLSSCREAKKDLPNKKSIGCWILIASIPHGTEMLMFCCVTHLFVFFGGNNFLNQWVCPQVAIFFRRTWRSWTSCLHPPCRLRLVEVQWKFHIHDIWWYMHIYMYNIQWEFQDPKMEVR